MKGIRRKRKTEITIIKKGKYGTTIQPKDKTVFHKRQFWFNRLIPLEV